MIRYSWIKFLFFIFHITVILRISNIYFLNIRNQLHIYVGRLISLVNFHEMALQFIWWCDISKDPLFEPLQAKFQPERTHNSRLVVIWSRLSQSLQNTHWRRQRLPHLMRISSHRAKFLSLWTERSHTGPNPENRVDEESIHSL